MQDQPVGIMTESRRRFPGPLHRLMVVTIVMRTRATVAVLCAAGGEELAQLVKAQGM